MYNFILTNADTDAISFCKQDGSEFSLEEQENLLKEINGLLPSKIKFEHDGIFKSFIVLRAKNYIMYDGKKIKLKGSALKSSTLEPIIKSMLNEMIDALVFDRQEELVPIYNKYVKMACNIEDMKPWAKKVTISTKTINSERANETKIIDALKRSNKPFSEGDKVYCFFLPNGDLELVENFKKEYNLDKYTKKLFNATERFDTILDTKALFPNYSLKRNKKLLEQIL